MLCSLASPNSSSRASRVNRIITNFFCRSGVVHASAPITLQDTLTWQRRFGRPTVCSTNHTTRLDIVISAPRSAGSGPSALAMLRSKRACRPRRKVGYGSRTVMNWPKACPTSAKNCAGTWRNSPLTFHHVPSAPDQCAWWPQSRKHLRPRSSRRRSSAIAVTANTTDYRIAAYSGPLHRAEPPEVGER